MREHGLGGAAIVERLKALPDPYRGNALEWLRNCTQSPMEDPEVEIERFLDRLPPTARATFVFQAGKLLETALGYFGAR
jgi:hypothetical protein